jgi:hypothetical protein
MMLPRVRFTLRRLMAAVAVAGLVSWITLGDPFRTTVYAPGYSEDKFQSIRSGMSDSEVIRILGEPLKDDPNAGYRFLAYSATTNDGDYPVRRIWLDQAGKVISVESSWHFD